VFGGTASSTWGRLSQIVLAVFRRGEQAIEITLGLSTQRFESFGKKPLGSNFTLCAKKQKAN